MKLSDRKHELEYVATVLDNDLYDERPGPYYSNEDLKKLESLKPGDKIYVHRRSAR